MAYVTIQRLTASGFKTGFLAGPYASNDDPDLNVREATHKACRGMFLRPDAAGKIARRNMAHKTVYNRFSRWSEKGVWQKIFESVAGPSDPPKQAALDSSHVKVHRCANGGKGG
jgi:hypothetical protein